MFIVGGLFYLSAWRGKRHGVLYPVVELQAELRQVVTQGVMDDCDRTDPTRVGGSRLSPTA